MKPSKRYEWLFLYCLIWAAALQLSLWAWGGVIEDPLVRLWACAALALGDSLICALIWLLYEADGHRRGRPRLGPGGMPLPVAPAAAAKPASATSAAASPSSAATKPAN